MEEKGMGIEMHVMNRTMDNKVAEYHKTCVNEELKEELEMNENDKMEWNKSIGM